MFGSIPVTLVACASQSGGAKVSIAPKALEQRIGAVVCAPQSSEKNPFAAIEAQCAQRLKHQTYATVRRGRGGVLQYRYKTEKQMAKIDAAILKRKLEEESFQHAPPYVISTISIAGGQMPSMTTRACTKGVIHTTPSCKVKRNQKNFVKMDAKMLSHFMKQVKQIFAAKTATVEIVRKRATKLRYSRLKYGTRAFVVTRHETGVKRRSISIVTRDKRSHRCTSHVRMHGEIESRHLIYQRVTAAQFEYTQDERKLWKILQQVFIVRGEHEGKLYDARSRVSQSVMEQMTHF
nr:P1 protein [Pepper severe mosaic virus]